MPNRLDYSPMTDVGLLEEAAMLTRFAGDSLVRSCAALERGDFRMADFLTESAGDDARNTFLLEQAYYARNPLASKGIGR